MQRKMNEAELTDSFRDSLKNGDIYICLQPQINHLTRRMVGAEALIRWKHPVFGQQYPNDFIPILERNNLIFEADLFVFRKVCELLRGLLDSHSVMVPISVNMSRYDIYHHDYVESIEAIRREYNVPAKYLRVELTESSAIGGIELVTGVLDSLHGYGYLVEMDDFGSGYSSLNILKDLNVDIIKLDMRFLSGEIGGRGAVIIESVVQMARWLNTIIIAEGVETMEQADYMKSIGCKYIQGYLYFKPLSVEDFRKELQETVHEPLKPALRLVETIDAGRFWDPDSLETLIFSNLVGGAAIFNFNIRSGQLDVLRINENYLRELGMNQSEEDVIHNDPWWCFGDNAKEVYIKTIEKAISTREEASCETWRNISSKCCGDNKICVLSEMRSIGNADDDYLIYARIRNITAEKRRYDEVFDNDKKMMMAADQANVYAWEYTIATKEMRPCFRCMRDLGLPSLIENYPEPVIESGLFQPDYADEYRSWHRRLAEGEKSIEGIMPLTVGRVPFHVRYTTEFDENGRPLKAYGSATMVVKKSE